MDKFFQEMEIGDIHQRDKWQFELKSEFFPLPQLKKNQYTQEFYLFVPNALQINKVTYSKEQFYQDQSNFIRYKTPVFKFEELLNKENPSSPLTRLFALSHSEENSEHINATEDELKLFGNIVRSALRKRIGKLIQYMYRPEIKKDKTLFYHYVKEFCKNVTQLHEAYLECHKAFHQYWKEATILSEFNYIDDYISNTINYYLMGFLEYIRRSKIQDLESVDKLLCSVISQEKKHRENIHDEPRKIKDSQVNKEYILYRNNLLNKFILDALLLDTTRASIDTKLRHVIGSIAAGVAMLIFFVLFVWQHQFFIINSFPFILATVILYILKDRIKEVLKGISHKWVFKWFPDYATKIRTQDAKYEIGEMEESFAYIKEKRIPKEIRNIRNREFHAVLQKFKRPEKIIYYKRKVTIRKPPLAKKMRRYGLNIIFRYTINKFVQKADDPVTTYVTLDSETSELIKSQLPKVYHVNIILKNSFTEEDYTRRIEFKKFRLVLDKNGIKRVEEISD